MYRPLRALSNGLRVNARNISTGNVRKVDTKVVKEIQEKQANFQASENPVHLTGGRIHFIITSIVGVAALGGTIYNLYELMKKF